MMDIDLEAIRARDAKWYDRHPLQEGASRDRRQLLQYLDELEQMVEDLALDVSLLRSRLNIAKIPDGESRRSPDAPIPATPGKLSP